LHTGAVVFSEELECDVASGLPRLIKLGNSSLHILEARERSPLPARIYIRRQDAVPGLGESGVLVPQEAMEGGSRTLEDAQAHDAAVQRDAILAADGSLNVPRLVSVLEEAVGVRLAVNGHAHPAVRHNLDMGDVDVAVRLDEVRAEDRGEELRRCDGVLLGGDVDGVFDGIRGDDDAVVGLGVGSVDLTLEKAAYGHLRDGLDAGGRVTVDLVDADIVLAIPSC
jgi:hypothetical protein